MNQDIKEAAARAGIRLWRIADELGIKDYSLSRKLRYELSADEKNKLHSIIDELSKEAQK